MAVEKINKLLALPKGWDGHRAEPVTIEAGIAMLSVLFSVMERRSLQPQLFPLASGGIQVEWHVSGSSIEIEVAADGHSGCALADGGEEAEMEFGIPILRDELAEFRRILMRFSTQAGRSSAR
ncbi:hypothetical protein [Streptomyces sp. NPDC050988]|uniref:hypothetical protein n=1 Tax=Streptomyces sp. NPDC050988 TaxID=3365637 RepID=UPI003796C7F4